MSHSRRTPVNDDMETISGLEDGETAADDVEPSCESYATEGSILNRASDKDTQQNDTIDLKATKQSLHARSNSSFVCCCFCAVYAAEYVALCVFIVCVTNWLALFIFIASSAGT
ncbi:hypothetical protein JG687_00010373 [Phytophthora cactorum]|uniref:Uncharacterized protein n=1 Tax=Phytophthora cactorum TaxID=29920 RepID=A0A8T1UB90_9STRA|nr:hypothetical protein JG687_00010373 [Phytophthora cactorum]